MKRTVGYARVSKDKQELSLQLDALKEAGCESKLIFQDKMSGARSDRPGLKECLKSLQSGDTLLVWRLDRLGRSLKHLVEIVEELKTRNIGFRSIKDGAIDTTSPSGELIFTIFSSMAQFERRINQERTKAGLAAARARGVVGGRKKLSVNDPRILRAKKLHANHKLPINEICTQLKVSRSTLYRWLEIKG